MVLKIDVSWAISPGETMVECRAIASMGMTDEHPDRQVLIRQSQSDLEDNTKVFSPLRRQSR